MNELALFSGAGGGILGGILCGFRTVCAVEIDRYARRSLIARQDDGCLRPFPIWDDVRTFDGRPWAGKVDIVTGGFPCQDISVAGKGAGISGARSGLWKEFARIIREVGPSFALVENSPALTSRGLGTVLGDLAAMGYDARWGVLGAEDAIWHSGNPVADHERERIWVYARTNTNRSRQLQSQRRIQNQWGRAGDLVQAISDTERTGQSRQGKFEHAMRSEEDCNRKAGEPFNDNWWGTEPSVGRVVHGVANRMDRLRAIGNGQVPAVVRLAWETLTEEIE